LPPPKGSLYIAAIAITLALAVWCTSEALFGRVSVASCDRLRLVALNSFIMTNGDYKVNSGASVAGNRCEDGAVPVEIGPRMAMTEAPQWLDEIRMEDSSHVRPPDLRPWRYTSILGAVSQEQPKYEDFGDPKVLLGKIPRDTPVQVVVVLATPLGESQVRGLWPNPLSVVFSPTRPLVWEDVIFCNFRAFDTCQLRGGAEPFTAQFRKWVSLLKGEDSTVLSQFDLKLAELQRTAEDGLIYAFSARDLAGNFKTIERDARVRALYVVDADLPRV
jgi:hypothetical protein